MAKAGFELKGMDQLLRNLNKEISGLKKRTLTGLIRGAIVIMNEADKMVPIDTSNLRHSFFIVTFRSPKDHSTIPNRFKGRDAGSMKAWHSKVIKSLAQIAKMTGSETYPMLIFGYSANYASFVHEKIDMTFRRPTAKPRWLFLAIQRNQDKILKEIQSEASF